MSQVYEIKDLLERTALKIKPTKLGECLSLVQHSKFKRPYNPFKQIGHLSMAGKTQMKKTLLDQIQTMMSR